MFSASVRPRPPPMIRGILTSYGYHISIFITILRLTTLGLLGIFSQVRHLFY